MQEAFARVGDILEVWAAVGRWPESQPFSGGVWDEWPNRLAQGLALLRVEFGAAQAYLRHEDEKRRKR